MPMIYKSSIPRQRFTLGRATCVCILALLICHIAHFFVIQESEVPEILEVHIVSFLDEKNVVFEDHKTEGVPRSVPCCIVYGHKRSATAIILVEFTVALHEVLFTSGSG